MDLRWKWLTVPWGWEIGSLRNGKSPKQVFWNLTKTYHLCDFFHFFNPMSVLPCSQPGKFFRLLVQTLRNGKSPKRAFWNRTKIYNFHPFSRLFPLFQPDERTTLQPARSVRRLLAQTLRNEKSAKRVFWNRTKTYHFPIFSTFSTRWAYYLAASHTSSKATCTNPPKREKCQTGLLKRY